ncbi:unnamed protein product [Protopolystoma xenopodis]|uniref:Uncharacterized protein n=1 Tax=Protopolystoma xenopodis TaxID=117903 RepID=A0A3S4ZR05_9PLAT|nr:unnamed protein product [Protopolystoma xenopodis]
MSSLSFSWSTFVLFILLSSFLHVSDNGHASFFERKPHSLGLGSLLAVKSTPANPQASQLSPDDAILVGKTNRRRLVVMRHAERVDICFGRSWLAKCFSKKGML